MSMDAIMTLVLLAGLAIVILLFVRKVRKEKGAAGGGGDSAKTTHLVTVAKPEAYFKTMFPELQPHFHPEKVARFVRARKGRGNFTGKTRWKDPSGFETPFAELDAINSRERVRLMDAADAVLAEFFYESQPQGAALRVGGGTLTVNIADTTNPQVRYWHPTREFNWSRKSGWRFTTAVAEESFDANDSGTRWSNDRASSPYASSALAAGATAALVAGGGGAFAGGGASDDWGAQPSGSDASTGTAY